MKNRKLHITITGDAGTRRSITLHKNTLRIGAFCLTVCALALVYAAIQGSHYVLQNKQLQQQATQLADELQDYTQRLNRQLTNARIELARIQREKEELTTRYEQYVSELKKDQAAQLKNSISRLDERAKVIETVIDKLGVKVEADPEHSGGPYIALDDKFCDKLICNTDRYLTVLQKMPLGLPINTRISSPFGRRIDPINKHRSFHAGIDFKGNTGDEVQATGNGVVKKSEYNPSLGNYIVISHGNGYETTFAHLSKRKVKKDETVERGDVIGLVGNTGRSTGSHLHYEVRLYGNPVNPMKYMQVAGMSVTAGK
jgi:murein DD-endopeptidase MepM/ murein hydrolase activator NlpD